MRAVFPFCPSLFQSEKRNFAAAMLYILADNQDITRVGTETLCLRIQEAQVKSVSCKAELLAILQQTDEAVVVLDYALFDFGDINALLTMHLRFPHVGWILFGEEYANDFVRRIVAEGSSFCVVNKNCDIAEMENALRAAAQHKRYVCRLTMEQLLAIPQDNIHVPVTLTNTEKEILKEIAMGKTTKEIAAERCSSFHTVNTHRKNIFRKLDVNTAYEATKYALRAGLIDSSDYYI